MIAGSFCSPLAGLPGLVASGILLWLIPASDLLRGTIVGALVSGGCSPRARPSSCHPAVAGHCQSPRRAPRGALYPAGAREEDRRCPGCGTARSQRLAGNPERAAARRAGGDALLRRVMEEIDVAVFAFDPASALRLANHAGELFLGRPDRAAHRSHRHPAWPGATLEGETPRILEMAVPGAGTGKWEVRRRPFRQGGMPLEMVVLTDQPGAPRRGAPGLAAAGAGPRPRNQQLPGAHQIACRHDEQLCSTARPAPDWEDDLRKGLDVVGARSEALDRFMATYARLANSRRRRSRRSTWVAGCGGWCGWKGGSTSSSSRAPRSPSAPTETSSTSC